MAAISETLRQARLRSGVDLDSLAAKTKINPRYLEAIENGDFEKLPGGIFARMFIKQYADAVGLDGASFADEFQRSSPTFGYQAPDVHKIVDSRPGFHPSVPGFASSTDRGRNDRLTRMVSSLIWVVGAVLVCAGAYYGLSHLPSHSGEPAAQTPSKVEPPPASAPVATPGNPGTANGTPTPAAPGSSPSAPPANGPEQPSPQSAAAAGSAPAPALSGPIQLILTATDTVWVSAISDGKTVISEAMPAGSSKSVAAEKGVRLTLGNAGGIEITFNGKKLEPFGPKGQVRTVDFTTFGAQVVSRTPPPGAKSEPPANPDPLR
jgi:cytoskeleton protein RodZ